MDMQGKTCVVTGAGRGIGRAVAVHLAAAGANIMASSRTEDDLLETQQQVDQLQHHGQCRIQVMDVTDAAQVERLMTGCRDAFGKIDVLVNNAGAARFGAIDELSPDDFDSMIQTNINAVFYAGRAAWPYLRETRGTIINISSITAEEYFPGSAAYGASKAWVNAFTRHLAIEGREFGIRIFAIAPGAVYTRILTDAFPGFEKEKALAPEQVARMVEWLLDEERGQASGSILKMNR